MQTVCAHRVIMDDGETAPVTPEARLLQRYVEGDEEALAVLVADYQTVAFWVARHAVGDDDIATDIVQDAFVRVLRKPDLYDPQRPFKAWFLQIVRNLAVDHLRRRRPTSSTEVAAVMPGPVAPDRVEHAELHHRIQTVLADVPEKYRELLIWRDVEEIPAEDIAEMIDVGYATTRWRIHHARKLFKKAWRSRYGDSFA